jgi:hypothetical protein
MIRIPVDDAAVNLRLASAIGWLADEIAAQDGQCVLGADRRPFDYRDPSCIWLIAKRCDMWPSSLMDGGGRVIGYELLWWDYKRSQWEHTNANTPELAVAMAVITRSEFRAFKNGTP